jgi:hypothetical protein
MAFVATIKTGGKFLSCAASATDYSVGTSQKDDGSGLQRWLLTPVGPDTYAVTSVGHPGAVKNLSCAASGGKVDLYVKDDKSGRQRWTFLRVADGVFTVSVEKGLASPASKFLTFSGDGKVTVGGRKAKGAGAANQQFAVTSVGPPPAPRDGGVFIGGAFDATQRSLAAQPDLWPTVAPKAGFWAHPMGVGAAKDAGYLPMLLSRFGVKKFVYEMDLLAWSDGTNPIQTNDPACWATWIREADPSFQCSFYAPWVEGNRVVDVTDDTVNRYAQIRGKMDATGYPGKGYFFTAPPSPDSIMAMDRLLSVKRNGMPIVEYVIRTAVLKGVALDFPAGLWLAPAFGPQFPPGSADKCRAFAKACFDITRKMGIPYVQVFNGSDSSVAEALGSMKAAGIVPDMVGIDNFADPSRSGVPESDKKSVSGQGKSAMAWLASNVK